MLLLVPSEYHHGYSEVLLYCLAPVTTFVDLCRRSRIRDAQAYASTLADDM